MTKAVYLSILQIGPGGRVKNCVWWPGSSLLLVNISGNRFCANIGRQHKSNGVYYIVDLQVMPLTSLGMACNDAILSQAEKAFML